MTVVLTCDNDCCIYNNGMLCTCDYVELDFTGECKDCEENEDKENDDED